MQVRKLTVPKLEFVLRYFTAGSMCRRFSLEEGIVFDPPYTEVTLKDDDAGRPPHQRAAVHHEGPAGPRPV